MLLSEELSSVARYRRLQTVKDFQNVCQAAETKIGTGAFQEQEVRERERERERESEKRDFFFMSQFIQVKLLCKNKSK